MMKARALIPHSRPGYCRAHLPPPRPAAGNGRDAGAAARHDRPGRAAPGHGLLRGERLLEHAGDRPRMERGRQGGGGAASLFRTAGIGLSQWRVNLGPGPTPSASSDPGTRRNLRKRPRRLRLVPGPGTRWFMRAALRYGVPHLVAFCNSPPARFTVNGLTNAHGLDAGPATWLRPGSGVRRLPGRGAGALRPAPDPAERVVFHAVSP